MEEDGFDLGLMAGVYTQKPRNRPSKGPEYVPFGREPVGPEICPVSHQS